MHNYAHTHIRLLFKIFKYNSRFKSKSFLIQDFNFSLCNIIRKYAIQL